MLTDRQKVILKLIVEEFVKTAEPVGSRTLSKLLDFSSATIRNDMADLEEFGFIEKTHSSSGRVPSETGYHYYVETLLKDDDDFDLDLTLIDDLFNNEELAGDETIEQAMNLLSQLTNYTTIALGPNARNSRVKKIELVPIYDQLCVLLVITNLGHVESKNITLPKGTSPEELTKIMEIFNDILYDVPIGQVSEKIHYEINHKHIKDLLVYNRKIIEAFLDAFTRFTQSKYYLSGQSNMLYQPEFSDVERVRELMNFFEKNDILKLIEHGESNGLTVRIGRENQITAMNNCSVVMVPYEVRDGEKGTIAVVGPTRMEYQKVIPLLKYLAAHMSKLYKE
ncbi:MAG: heat-inducible transcriptional repressor HrcA [Candidatus Izemoplasmataceae bacterium]|jgi:heat-inducible transcriptional repressor